MLTAGVQECGSIGVQGNGNGKRDDRGSVVRRGYHGLPGRIIVS